MDGFRRRVEGIFRRSVAKRDCAMIPPDPARASPPNVNPSGLTMHSPRGIVAVMDARSTAARFAVLFPVLYGQFYNRRDPRAHRPSGEALAMLEHLRDSGPLTVTEAARHFDRSQAAISERIARLLERGLVERLPDERDQRRHFVWLTEAGEQVLRQEREILSRNLVERATRQMVAADRDALLRGIEALLDASRADAHERRKKER